MTDADAYNAAIADLNKRIAFAKANGDDDPLNRLVDMQQYLVWCKDALATASAKQNGAKK
jgi:hypothetical protein